MCRNGFPMAPTEKFHHLFSVSFIFLVGGWTFLIVSLMAWSWYETLSHTEMMARREAYKGYEKDLMMRAWATMHGGVYVPVTKETQPNPYLTGVLERDITTPSGRKLTLINPAYVTRQVHELSRSRQGVISHITSLNPIRPENRPDGWETAALLSFEQGVKDYYGYDSIGYVKYFRYMAPLVVEQRCLTCHAVQGYMLGDIRGGISSSVPWAEYEWSIDAQLSHSFVGFSVLWVIGSIGLFAYNRRIVRYIAQRDREESERKIAEAALRRSERLLREAQHVGRIGYFVTDYVAQTWESSPVLDEIFGIDDTYPKDFDHWGALIAPDQWTKVAEHYKKMVNEKTGFNLDYKIIRFCDKQERLVSVVGEFDYDEAGVLVRQIGTVQDITERKNLELQLIQSQKLEGVGTLAGGIAHDFNNLLALILGSAELLRTQLERNPELKKYADRIVEASERGTSISRQLLIFSRPNEAELKPISMSQTIAELKEMLGHFLPKTITILTDSDSANTLILGDAGQIHQALLNLSLNAGDAMANSGPLSIDAYIVSQEFIRARYTPDASVPYVAVDVTDTGTGMDESIVKNIFDPFFTTKEYGKGTGLGLAIVHGIVKNHNGFIDVNSTPGKGSTFTLYFPSLQHKEEQEQPPAALQQKEQTGTILLVDDEPLLREMIAEFLTEIGCTVHEAQNGAEALEWYTANHASVDLVITDLGMPEMGGEELFRKLRTVNERVKVIVSSGYLDGTSRTELLDMGISDVLTKPCKMQDIQKAVHDVLMAGTPPG